nr:Flp pilus assembly protein CpaB [Alteraurantiacibacter aestuarii]
MLVIAAVVGIVAVIIANAWFSGMEQRQDEAQITLREQETVQIVVATQPLEYGTALSDQNLRLQYWPAASVPQGAFLTVDAALQDRRVAIRPIVPGEPVLASKVSGADGRATLAALVPAGMRAVSLPVDAIRGVAGFVVPGSSVDVILTRRIAGGGARNEDLRSDVILENVQVLAVDQTVDDTEGEPRVSQTATVAVSLVDAQRLAVAQGVGTVSLALRSITELASIGPDGQASGMATVTAANLGSRAMYIPATALAPPPVTQTTYISRDDDSSKRAGSASAPVAVSVPQGPRMEIVRGTQPTSYPVGRARGE